MPNKKSGQATIGSSKIKQFQDMISSDSDSYGSDGQIKEKAVVITKRGGKKRNNKTTKDALAMDWNEVEDTVYSSDTNNENTTEPVKLDEDDNQKGQNKEEEQQDVQAQYVTPQDDFENEEPEQIQKNLTSQQKRSESEATSKKEDKAVPVIVSSKYKGGGGNYVPKRGRQFSPPMIKEYDPNEDNAKTRAKKRAEAIKKREKSLEIDKTQYPEDPTPWKGKPSEFFIVHTSRRGDQKVLNNSQKEFILIYYPDNVADEVSLMEFLYKQAKDAEDQKRWDEAEKERDLRKIVGGKSKAAKRRRNRGATEHKLVHTNKEPMMTKDNRPMSFEAILEDQKRGQDPSDSIFRLREQIQRIQVQTNTQFAQAQNVQRQHSEVASSQVGYCAHCHNHMPIQSISQTNTLHDETEIQRQNILHQICEAKKRQARMEAEEARRLTDEARRLAEQANILELEAQRPLLEARKLEEEARQIEAQFARIPQHLTSARGATSSQPMGSTIGMRSSLGLGISSSSYGVGSSSTLNSLNSLYGDSRGFDRGMEPDIYEERKRVQERRAQIMEQARRTQEQIRMLQESAMLLQERVSNPISSMYEMRPQQQPHARQTISEDMRPLYEALEGPTPSTVKKGPVFVASQNSIAAREARGERVATSKPATKKVQPIKEEEHNYSYGEESEDDQEKYRDPVLDAAAREFEKAKRAFEEAQKVKEAAVKKKEDKIRKQQEEIKTAQEETAKYFEEAKKKAEEEKRKKPVKANRQQDVEDNTDEYDKLLESFNDYSKRLIREKNSLNMRYGNRNEYYEFLGPILSGQMIQQFDEKQGYINFSPYILSDNFTNGHQEYFFKWRHLFLYEQYSFLMNSRWSKFTGNDIELKNQLKQQQSEKAMCWKGYFGFHKMEGKFCVLKLFKEPPNVFSYSTRQKNYSKIYDDPDRHEGANFDLSHCREDDLIVMSKFRINLEGQEDIKMVTGGVKFLKEVLNKPGVIFGYVARSNTKADNFVEIFIDGKYGQQYQIADGEESGGPNVFTRYCYHFESLLTSLREFKALKSIEFTRLAPVLTYPTLSLKYKDDMITNYCNTIESAFENLDEGPQLNSKFYELDEEKQVSQMNNYLIKNHPKFNKSQAKVLEQVIEMPKDHIQLIQGPPGTGKTHTIIGIISMIMSTRLANSKQKIMVCAPSNAAIDQIIIRIIEKGLIGLNGLKNPKKRLENEDSDSSEQEEKKKTDKKKANETDSDDDYEPPDLSQTLVRITSAEYQTETAIKKHTLEQRIIKKLCIEKFGDLKKCIQMLKDMLSSMNDFESWEDNSEFPFVNKIKYKNYTNLLRSSGIKKVDNWGDPNLNRQQQIKAMESQLKIHQQELNDFKSGSNVHQGNTEWKEAEKAIISESNIVCCTLSMAGSAKLQNFINQFEYLIVDEACQSTEPSTLIPFQLCPKRVILVGDQKQLPATTFSGNSQETGYCRSLFERLLDSGFDKLMLTIQFRMHPKIRAFPSEQFYEGAITDHSSIGTRSAPLQISNLAQVFTNRLVFFDIQNSDEVYDNKSKCNFEEADFTKLLVDFIARKSSLQGTLKYIAGKIGVISPYKAQVKQLYQRLEKLCSDQACNISDTIEVNTVDAFQGSEKDIIIFNCVRSNFESMMEKSLGFLLDERRLNVAITRPKYFLLVVGNAKTLRKSDVWDNMINYCMQQGKFIEIRDRTQFDSMSAFKNTILPQFMN